MENKFFLESSTPFKYLRTMSDFYGMHCRVQGDGEKVNACVVNKFGRVIVTISVDDNVGNVQNTIVNIYNSFTEEAKRRLSTLGATSAHMGGFESL